MEREAKYGAPPANARLEAFLGQMMDESAVLPEGSPARELIEAGVVEVRLLQRHLEQMTRNLAAQRIEIDARIPGGAGPASMLGTCLSVVDAVLAARDARTEYQRLEMETSLLDRTAEIAAAKVVMERTAACEAAIRMQAACAIGPQGVAP